MSPATKALPNNIGVFLNISDSNTIGGSSAGAANVISGNNQYGLEILGSSSQSDGNFNFGGTGNLVEGDFIGTDATGARAVPNGTGIYLMYGGANTIGGMTAGARNIISGNAFDGINISYVFTTGSTPGNLVEGDFIGTDATGTHAIPDVNGIDLEDAGSTTIGGTAAGCGQRHLRQCPAMGSSSTNSSSIMGSCILPPPTRSRGTSSAPTRPVGWPCPTAGDGILIEGGTQNTIGGSAAGAGNIIAFNGRSGVGIEPNVVFVNFNFSDFDLISANSIFANGGLGIDLGNDGVTPNNPAGSALGSESCSSPTRCSPR